MSGDGYDVFLSHNSEDKPAVEELARKLKTSGLEPWLDKWNLVPGDPWQEAIERALRECRSCAVFFGPGGVSPWHHEELRSAIARRVESPDQSFRVVPVLLPGAGPVDRQALPTFLARATWVEFRSSLDEPDALHRLECGIRGVAPGAGPEPAREPNLDDLYERRAEQRARGEDTSAVEEEIQGLKRDLRSNHPNLTEGYVLGDRFSLRENIGQGGFGTIWRAFDLRDRKFVAVKVLHVQHRGAESLESRFFRGARQMARLEHPHIVRVVEPKGQEAGYCYFAMEHVTGGNLETAVKEGRLTREQIVEILENIAEALRFAWDSDKLIHRDVKPSNILIDAEGRGLLSDFDLAKSFDATMVTVTGQTLGSYFFMAPEVMKNLKNASRKSDCFSLARTLLWALSDGYAPSFPGEEEMREAFERARLEKSLADVLRRALAQDPGVRFESAFEFFQSFSSALAPKKSPSTKARKKSTSGSKSLLRKFDLDPEELERLIADSLSGTEDSHPEQSYRKSIKEVQTDRTRPGTVMHMAAEGATVNLGGVAKGFLPRREFDESAELNVGDTVFVKLDSIDALGIWRLSNPRANRVRAWERFISTHVEGDTVQGRVTRKIKGGLLVDVGIQAFLPDSQVAVRRSVNSADFIGQEIECRLLKIDPSRMNVVLSRRKVLEEKRARQKEQLLAEIAEGEVRKGIVKNITDFGAFVDLGGIDALLHITDITWGRISHPSEMIPVDDEIVVKVLKVDRERERISVGLKQMTDSPWKTVEAKYPVGTVVKGEVVNMMSYGAYVMLEDGIEGMVHLSHMSWTRRVNHPSDMLSLGERVNVVVLAVDAVKQEISLGMKQVESNPWDQIEEKYSPGTIIRGRVRNLSSYGAFVEIEEGIDGLLHVSDISWTEQITHPSEVLQKGQEIDAVVLTSDRTKRRIALGLKQLTPRP